MLVRGANTSTLVQYTVRYDTSEEGVSQLSIAPIQTVFLKTSIQREFIYPAEINSEVLGLNGDAGQRNR